MDLKILTPEKVVVEATDVSAVSAMAADGSVGILPHHVPMVTPLQVANLTYTKAGQSHAAAVMGGMLSTDGQHVTILSEAAELAQDVDIVRAEAAKKRAEARLAENKENLDVKRAELAMARALVRLKLKK